MAFTVARSVRPAPTATRAARPASSVRPAVRAAPRFVVRADPANKNAVETAIKEAEEACADTGKTGECAAAWDTVEEISAAISHKKAAIVSQDPLDKYCDDNPEADECRVYED